MRQQLRGVELLDLHAAELAEGKIHLCLIPLLLRQCFSVRPGENPALASRLCRNEPSVGQWHAFYRPDHACHMPSSKTCTLTALSMAVTVTITSVALTASDAKAGSAASRSAARSA